MKILYLTHYFPPEGNAPATRVASLTKRWVKAGNQVTVVTGVPNVPNGIVYQGYKNGIIPQEEVVEGVKVIRVWTWIAPNKGTIRRIINYLSYMMSSLIRCIFMRRPDVIIATSPQFFCGWAGVFAKWWFRMTRPIGQSPRFILEIRDIWPESIGAVGAMSKGLSYRILELLESRMYVAANHIVTVGEGYKKRLTERGIPDLKISIVTNGIDRTLFDNQVSKSVGFKKKWDIEGKFICSYIGTIGMASGLSVYLRAAVLLKKMGRDDVRLLAVGDGAVRNELQKQALEQNLDNVIFTGRCAKGEVPEVLAASDVCFVHLRKTPLFETVLPSKMFEAMGAKKAILLGVNGDARKLLEDSGSGFFMTPEDETQLVHNLIQMADGSKGKLLAMGEKGFKFVLDHYDLDQLSSKYLGILTKCINPINV